MGGSFPQIQGTQPHWPGGQADPSLIPIYLWSRVSWSDGPQRDRARAGGRHAERQHQPRSAVGGTQLLSWEPAKRTVLGKDNCTQQMLLLLCWGKVSLSSLLRQPGAAGGRFHSPPPGRWTARAPATEQNWSDDPTCLMGKPFLSQFSGCLSAPAMNFSCILSLAPLLF